MKTMVVIFEAQTYTSKADGSAKVVVCSDRLRAVLGQAKVIRLEWVGFRMSPNSEVKLKVWESSYAGMRPSELEQAGAPFFTSQALTVLRPAPENVTGPFGGYIDVTMEVRNSVGATLVDVEGVVCATLVMEE